MQIRRFLRALAASVALLAAMAASQSANASSLLTVRVLVPTAVPAGFDAPVIIRAEGDQPELASLDYEVSGGQIVGAVPLNSIAPGVAEGTVYVRREAPGDATLTVRSQGVVTAVGAVHFAAYGRITVSATLAASAHASARTWRFEVVDATGAVVDSVSAGTSGDSSTGSATSVWLPYGSYTVRQVLGNDTRTSCNPGTFYAITSPAGGTTAVVLAGLSAGADFALNPCADAPTSLGVSIPIDTIAADEPINEVRGARQSGPPLPPAAGSGLISPDQMSKDRFLFVAACLIAVSITLTGSLLLAERARKR